MTTNTTADFIATRTTAGLRDELRALERKISTARATTGEWQLAQAIEAEIERRVLSA